MIILQKSRKLNDNWNNDYQQNRSDDSKYAKLFLFTRNMLLFGLYKVLVGCMDVLVGLIDVLLGGVQLCALLVDHSLHVLLHLERINHSALNLLYLFLFDFDHSFVMQRLLVHLVHLNLRETPFAVLLFVLDSRLAELSVFMGGGIRMSERVARKAVTRLVSTISSSLSSS